MRSKVVLTHATTGACLVLPQCIRFIRAACVARSNRLVGPARMPSHSVGKWQVKRRLTRGVATSAAILPFARPYGTGGAGGVPANGAVIECDTRQRRAYTSRSHSVGHTLAIDVRRGNAYRSHLWVIRRPGVRERRYHQTNAVIEIVLCQSSFAFAYRQTMSRMRHIAGILSHVACDDARLHVGNGTTS